MVGGRISFGGHLALRCGRLRQERRTVLLNEMGSAISGEYKECACDRVWWSEVVECCGGVFFKKT